MTDCRLNNLFLLYIHNDHTDKLDMHKVAIRNLLLPISQRRIGNFHII